MNKSAELITRLIIADHTVKQLLLKITDLENDKKINTEDKKLEIKKIKDEITKVTGEIDNLNKEIKLLGSYNVN